MSRRTLATSAQSTTVDPAAFLEARAPVRVPTSMVLDILMLWEILLVVAAAGCAKLLYVAFYLDSEQPHQPYLVAGLAGGVAIHYLMRVRGLYDPAAFTGWASRVGELLVTIGLAFLMIIAIAYVLKISADYSRGWMLTWLALASLFLVANRPFASRGLIWLASNGFTSRRIAIIGSGDVADQLAQTLRATPGIAVMGVFADAATPGQNSQQASIADLISIGERNHVDEVVIALSEAPQRRTEQLIHELSVLPVDMWLCPAEFNMPILSTARLGTLSLLQVKPKPIRDWGYVLKLALDYVAGIISLIVFAPVMAVVALLIKLDSRGPVLFRQRRHGYNHRVIDVYKFRTMSVAENGDRVDQARANDPRVTRIGRFLRKTSLDELPQLFNVMKGEMSLVGPRPHAVAHNQHYRERLERYANRHCVKPGMTGWAQIKGFRGPTEDPEKMRKRVQMDLYYIENWSLWLDIKILVMTPFVGFIHRNAL
jgi:Undecaprenyl-phosphate glucose phosphotransferase